MSVRASSRAKHVTAEDVWNMPEVPGMQLEINEGLLVEVPGASVGHHLIVATILQLLDAFVREHALGVVFPDGLGFLLHRDPDILRIPDVSFVSNERLPEELEMDAFWQGTPDLAIEVASPHDSATELHAKVLQYLEAGTREVWVVWPDRATISVHAPNLTSRELIRNAVLDCGDIIPGFSVSVADIFSGLGAFRGKSTGEK